MITCNPNSLVRVVRLCISGLLIISGTGCAWRGATVAPITGPATAPIAGSATVPIAGSATATATAPEPARQSAGAPAPPMSGSTSSTAIKAPVKAPASAPASAPPSTPPVPRNSESTPAPLDAARAPSPVPPPAKVDHRKHAGNYHCDHGRTIRIADVADQTDVILLTWQGTQHRLERVHSNSGAERFEELSTGLVWILIPGKSMLLSTSQGRALANECHL